MEKLKAVPSGASPNELERLFRPYYENYLLSQLNQLPNGDTFNTTTYAGQGIIRTNNKPNLRVRIDEPDIQSTSCNSSPAYTKVQRKPLPGINGSRKIAQEEDPYALTNHFEERQVYLTNLKVDTKYWILWNHFGQYGKVKYAMVYSKVREDHNGDQWYNGFVEFLKDADAMEVARTGQFTIGGRVVYAQRMLKQRLRGNSGKQRADFRIFLTGLPYMRNYCDLKKAIQKEGFKVLHMYHKTGGNPAFPELSTDEETEAMIKDGYIDIKNKETGDGATLS